MSNTKNYSPTKIASQKADEPWDVIIRPKKHILEINLTELWEYRDLIRVFVRRDLVSIYKQTILGPLWFFIQPIMTTLVYVIVFGNIAKLSTDGIPGPLFYLSGITLWNYFSDSFNKTSSTFVSNAHIFGKVYFPRLVVPISIVISNLAKFLIQLALFAIVWVWYFTRSELPLPSLWIIATPMLLMLMAGLALGFGIIFSSLTTKYRDLSFLLQFAVQLAMYGTPIIYPLSSLSESYRAIIWWNPIAHIIECFKFAFLGTGQVDLSGLLYTTGFTCCLLFTGIVLFNRTERTFMDTV